MEPPIIARLTAFHKESMDLVKKVQTLNEKDIRRNLVEIISSQIAVSLITLKSSFKYFTDHKEEFKNLFEGNEEMIGNYIHNLKQNMIEAIMETVLYQTELVLRVLYSKKTGIGIAQEGNINRIFSTLFEDVENNWQKEDTKLLVLLWTMRNTIHTGGIYFKKPEGYSITYNGKEYKFDYGKSFQFLKDDNHILDLLSAFLSVIETLFNSKIIEDLGEIEHPSHQALA